MRHGAVDGTVDRVGLLVEVLICFLFIYIYIYIYIRRGRSGGRGPARSRRMPESVSLRTGVRFGVSILAKLSQIQGHILREQYLVCMIKCLCNNGSRHEMPMLESF